MSDNSLEREKTNFRQAMMILVPMGAIPILIVTWGAVLWILAFLVTLVVPSIGVYLFIRSQSSADRDSKAVEYEIDAMATDASFDLSEQIIVWDKLMFTQGVGTALEGRKKVIADIYRRLMNARDEISAAQTTKHKVEAVLAADSILATSRSVI